MINSDTLKQSQLLKKVLTFLERMSGYKNLLFILCQLGCEIFQKPKCFMINVMKINCGLILIGPPLPPSMLMGPPPPPGVKKSHDSDDEDDEEDDEEEDDVTF